MSDFGKIYESSWWGEGVCGNTIDWGSSYKSISNCSDASFSYAEASYAKDASDPTPTITGDAGGTFTATPAGLSINSSTGEVTLSTSTINSYTVKYTLSDGTFTTQTLGVTAASFSSTKSIEFDGIDGYMTCGNFNSLASVNTFTVSFWAKFNTVALNDTLLNHYSTLGFRADAQNNKMTFRWSSSDSTTVLVQSTNTITTGTWKHYACTYDNTDFKLYENGALISTTNEPSKTYRSNLNQNLLMGKYWFGLQRLFDGLMDELSIFNYALTPSEITSIYNSGSPTNLDDLTTSPSLWLRMGEDASWDGSKWTLTGQGSDTYTAESSNMIEADRKEDTPPTP